MGRWASSSVSVAAAMEGPARAVHLASIVDCRMPRTNEATWRYGLVGSSLSDSDGELSLEGLRLDGGRSCSSCCDSSSSSSSTSRSGGGVFCFRPRPRFLFVVASSCAPSDSRCPEGLPRRLLPGGGAARAVDSSATSSCDVGSGSFRAFLLPRRPVSCACSSGTSSSTGAAFAPLLLRGAFSFVCCFELVALGGLAGASSCCNWALDGRPRFRGRATSSSPALALASPVASGLGGSL